MNISKELIEKAKTAKTAEELLEMAKEESIEMSAEQAAEYFATIHASGELSDEELDNVSGGCGSGDEPLFTVGQWVYVRATNAAALILENLGNCELSDEELDNVAGGCGDTPDRSYDRRKACRWDADGNATHWYALDHATGRIDVIVYFTCPKCGGMLHEGFGYKLFCDPCDTSYNDYFNNVDVHKIY